MKVFFVYEWVKLNVRFSNRPASARCRCSTSHCITISFRYMNQSSRSHHDIVQSHSYDILQLKLLADFSSEQVAGLRLESVAEFIGIRTYSIDHL